MTELTKLQNILLDILKVTNGTLEKHGIKPMLVGGSCIGAVRHGGIIPWDDDIDIALFREDYEKAREILINELPEGYTYCDERTEKDYPYSFGKVRKDGTAFVNGGDSHLDIHQGIYLDIFPCDALLDGESSFNAQYKRCLRLKQKVDLKCMSYRKNGKLRPVSQLPLIFLGHLLVNKRKTQQKLHKEMTRYNAACPSSKYAIAFGGNWGKRERIEREWYAELCEVDFNGVRAYIPAGYDAYLTSLYGDYMTPPPEDKRISHHDAIFISFTEEFKK